MALRLHGPDAPPMLSTGPWQMSYGERAALEGILAQIKPHVALEIGTAEGGSLRRLASHSDCVHAFDLLEPPADLAEIANVTFHTGDSHELLSETLAQLEADGASVDFVLIDGDHSAEGVRRDVEDVLVSPAVTRTMIVLHDTMNPEVRRGIEAIDLARDPKVALLELDLVPGFLARREPYRLQLWGGLGLIVVDSKGEFEPAHGVRDRRFHELFSVLGPCVELMSEVEARGDLLHGLDAGALGAKLSGEIRGLRERGARRAAPLASLQASAARRLRAPLRTLRRRTAGRRRG